MSAADAHAHAYDEAKHPRGARGRFAGGGTATIVQPRSLTRGEAWQRTGAKLPGIPIGYTGSREKELPVGSFTHHQLKAQVPDAMSADDHRELVGSLVSVIANERSSAIEKGHERRLIPDGTERHTINRAYNHAAMHSLHSFGTHDYDFKMDDHLKAELTPLVPFMRYAHRRDPQARAAEPGADQADLTGDGSGDWRDCCPCGPRSWRCHSQPLEGGTRQGRPVEEIGGYVALDGA